ncbi:MAG: hypothetical protein IPM74_19385 [Crocinitomicaceae bacterium]|nr:hypothetical protein [Crocinitomicaceae bacterium]
MGKRTKNVRIFKNRKCEKLGQVMWLRIDPEDGGKALDLTTWKIVH